MPPVVFFRRRGKTTLGPAGPAGGAPVFFFRRRAPVFIPDDIWAVFSDSLLYFTNELARIPDIQQMLPAPKMRDDGKPKRQLVSWGPCQCPTLPGHWSAPRHMVDARRVRVEYQGPSSILLWTLQDREPSEGPPRLWRPPKSLQD
eukprot:gene4675-biopygen616